MPTISHPQNRVPANVIDYVTALIRRGLLDGEELHDITTAVDLDDECPVGDGEDLHHVLTQFTDEYGVSAAFLVSEACIALGWPPETR